MKNKQAFTLIELLVVVLIIGILAAVAVPQYQKTVMKSRFATLKNLTKSIANAQEVFYLANNQYATTFNELDIDMGDIPEDKNDKQRNFFWGHCNIYNGTIQCSNTDINMNFVIYLTYSSSSSKGKTYCMPTDTATKLPQQHQICQQETGSNTYEGSFRYKYQK